MAVIEAQKRSDDVIAKYRKRMDDWSKANTATSPDEFDAIVSELRDDIVNAINAAVHEVHIDAADKTAKDKSAKAEPPEPPRFRPATTHMPATGHDKPAARK